MEKAIITCALTQGPATRDPADPPLLTPDEIAGEAQKAVSAGAAVVRLHPRDEQGNPTSDVNVLRQTIRRIQERSDCLIEVSTLVRPDASTEERVKIVSVKPDIASVACGSVNLGDQVLIQSADSMRQIARAAREQGVVTNLVCFDHGHIANARRLIDDGWVGKLSVFSLILGTNGGARGDIRTLMQMVDTLPRGSVWAAAGVGKAARLIVPAALLMGGHPRVGFEDNLQLRTTTKASSNAEIVKVAITVAQAIGRNIATATEAGAVLSRA